MGETMKSVIGSFYTLSACTDKIPNMKLDDWKAYNSNQEKYLEIYKNCMGAKIPEIEYKVSQGDVTPVNDFLRQRGFSIQLDQIGPFDLAIASILEVILKWLTKGKKTALFYQLEEYKAVNLSSGVEVVLPKSFAATAKILTKNGDTVFMTIPAEKPTDSFEVFEMARKLIAAKTSKASHYENRAIFPMVDLDTQPDISWIIGLSDKRSEKWEIAQALQQTKVKMDEEGVVIREAVALGVRCLAASFPSTYPLVIDEPFLFVVKREGLKEPLFSAFLNTDGWIKDKTK